MANILIVVARFYEDVAEALIEGAVAELDGSGHTVEIVDVPGALEIPAAIAMAIESNKYDGYVALGCVIRGETTHYDYVCQESARGLNDIAMNMLVPIGNGILTVETKTQAMTRAQPDQKDKGGVAARACLSMLALSERFGVNG